jgi:antitoxin FitA
MAAVTIRNLSDETHRALKARAARHNRGTEAEVRAILDAAVRPETKLRLGDALAAIGEKNGVTSEDVAALQDIPETLRDKRPAEPMSFD